MKEFKKQDRYVSLFTKLFGTLVLIGIVPLVVMGISIYNVYLNSLKETLLSNMYRTTRSIGRNVEDLFSEMSENTKYLYTHQVEDYGYLYEILENEELSENKKKAAITDMLRDILYMNQHIEDVIFILPDGRIYTVMRPPEAVADTDKILAWHRENFQSDSKNMQILPSHMPDYYAGSKKQTFSVARNIMNIRTVQTVDTEILGTLYININSSYLDGVIHETKLEEGSRIYLVDKEQKNFAYNPYEEEIFTDKLGEYLELMTEEYQYIRTEGDYYIYSQIPGSSWMVLEKIPSFYLENSYRSIRNITLAVIGVGIVLLGILYYLYSKKMNRPIRTLKEAMEQIQKGKLDTRVQINSNDEIGFLSRGLNSMTEKLQMHIRKVYVAEIKQREAEIEALKTQIRPHHLYNTLDVIRMTAITNDDDQTAEMLDGLSGQLKYLIGNARDRVTLQAELDSVRNYFKIIRVRYENKMTLEIDVPENLLDLEVPQLVLQPIVENSVKYGLRPKEGGNGVVAIRGEIQEAFLELTIMDNGVGMSEERLRYIQKLLEDETEKCQEEESSGIGIKNVYERIKLIFGEEYRIEISSFENIGTIVKYRLPVTRAGEQEREKEYV